MSMNPVIHDGHAAHVAHGGVTHGGGGGHHEFPGGDFEFPPGSGAAAATAAAAAAAYHSDHSLFHHFSHAAAAAYPTSASNGSAAGGKEGWEGTAVQTRSRLCRLPPRMRARFSPISPRLFCDRSNGDLAFSQSENGEKDAAEISGRRRSASIAEEEEVEQGGGRHGDRGVPIFAIISSAF